MGQSKSSELCRDVVVKKVNEMLDCIIKIDKQNFFEINIKYINGDVTTHVGFSDKDKVK